MIIPQCTSEALKPQRIPHLDGTFKSSGASKPTPQGFAPQHSNSLHPSHGRKEHRKHCTLQSNIIKHTDTLTPQRAPVLEEAFAANVFFQPPPQGLAPNPTSIGNNKCGQQAATVANTPQQQVGVKQGHYTLADISS